MSSDRDEIWTPREVAERWKISARTVRDMLEQGELPGFKVRREWRIYLSQVSSEGVGNLSGICD